MTSDFAFQGTQTATEWADWALENAVNDAGTIGLERERLPAYVDPTVVAELATDESPLVDVAIDDCGTRYLLHESGHVERLDPNGRRVRIGCTTVFDAPGRATALTVTDDTIYVGYTTQNEDGSPETRPGAITAIASAIEQQRWTTHLDATPIGFARDVNAVSVITDTGAEGVVSTLNRDGTLTTRVDGLPTPLDVAIDDAGTLGVLTGPADAPALYRFPPDALGQGIGDTSQFTVDISLPAQANALAGGARDELVVGRSVGGGAVSAVRVTGTTRDAIGGMTRAIDALALGEALTAVTDGGTRVVTMDARDEHTQHTDGGYVGILRGTYDAGNPATTWHRLTLGFEATEPAVQVRVSYAATDDSDPESVDWNHLDPNPHDALVSEAQGRYLHLRITLQGDRFHTPQLHTVRAYFPRQSLLRYLPAIYQDDPESREFLEAFLSIFESTFVGIDEELAAFTRCLDPAGVPPAFLGWLENWLALDPDETWPEGARRAVLDDAPSLFRDRGTPSGLLDLLGIYLDHVADPSPAWEARLERQLAAVDDREDLSPADARDLRRRIESHAFLLEYSDLDCASGESRDAYRRLMECPQCFFVFVRPFVTDDQLHAIQRLVDDVRPAHAEGRVVELEGSVVLGGHSYLGVNSVLPERDLVVGEGTLGRDSVLDTHETAGQLAVRARLGDDTRLS